VAVFGASGGVRRQVVEQLNDIRFGRAAPAISN
jgi:uncharacterized protein YbjT (DUF2867 family)